MQEVLPSPVLSSVALSTQRFIRSSRYRAAASRSQPDCPSGIASAFASVPEAKAEAIPDGQSGWDREAAARYLDDRINLWVESATELRTGEGKTSCISCHTVVPYLLARPALRKAMQRGDPTQQEVKLLKEIAQRVETYPDHESLSDAKHGGERGTEAVLNALILARQDS